MLEIEQKFRVDDLSRIAAEVFRLFEVVSDTSMKQVDWYYSHPARDFGATDEALRVRRLIVLGAGENSKSLLTYKGPRIDPLGENQLFKTRHEIELPLGESVDDADRLGELLEALGFLATATVTKVRRSLQVQWGEWKVEFALDDVEGLGAFVEIEIVADEDSTDPARQVISELAGMLNLELPITSGYRNMLYS